MTVISTNLAYVPATERHHFTGGEKARSNDEQ